MKRLFDGMVKMFRGMLLALLPATALSLYLFREKALFLILVGVSVAVFSEALFQFIFKRKYTFKDGGAVVTGLLLALSVSPSTPLYVLAISTAVGMIFGKHVFGGFPKNLFNPALFGRLFLVLAFPTAMTPWLSPVDLQSTATPLRVLRDTGSTSTSIWNLFIGNIGGSIGEVSALLLLVGGAYLIRNKYANWRIPAAVLSTMAVVAVLSGQNPLFHLFSGSAILGAFFMATDPVTSPKSDQGRWIFGIGVGFLIMAMRLWGWVPEGTTFAIIGMNYLVPFINTEMTRLKSPKAV
ncbi:RnfABCDGE type electron transport complex subunit D [Proteiniclasticum ruminis]|uniref:Electron transport complex protein RnfD n=1 Tax=Proteiniclasticum ruminis TaxID=398199 RepID=A0A1I4XIF4_9CLOT|nr:RnfABCDGE type electron transport complex subunit D [Proteiniclasticum ruminis]SFN25273.1 electron transport complex protein RnfD [Proteiniclasticum ruminis]